MSDARQDVLAAVRRALGRGDGATPPSSGRAVPQVTGDTARHAPDGGPTRGPDGTPRGYRGPTGSAGQAADVDLLVDRLLDYRASVRRCSPDELPAVLAQELEGVPGVVVPAGLDRAWLADLDAAGVEVLVDDPAHPLSHAALDAVGAALTACRVAVAETGTIVLDGAPDQGRRVVTLLPDRHVCVVAHGQVVPGVPDAVALLGEHPERPLTWVSGPSATSDIELVRVEGVHGPRDLRVVLVG